MLNALSSKLCWHLVEVWQRHVGTLNLRFGIYARFHSFAILEVPHHDIEGLASMASDARKKSIHFWPGRYLIKAWRNNERRKEYR